MMPTCGVQHADRCRFYVLYNSLIIIHFTPFRYCYQKMEIRIIYLRFKNSRFAITAAGRDSLKLAIQDNLKTAV